MLKRRLGKPLGNQKMRLAAKVRTFSPTPLPTTSSRRGEAWRMSAITNG